MTIPDGRAAAVVVVIPAYQPDHRLPTLVDALLAAGVAESIVVVDDGSSGPALTVLASLRTRAGVTVLRHAVNLGKGQALKSGFNHVLCLAPHHVRGVVTADADGQHLARDIGAVAAAFLARPDALMLGSRNLRGTIPWKSRIGNGLTRLVFRGLVGRKLEDTQTGLRAIPLTFLPTLLRTSASGYEFELEMLLAALHQGIPVVEVPIQTVYEDDNKGSHFNPIRDSVRIYFVFVRFLLVSMATAAIDFCVFALMHGVTHNVALSTASARLVAGTFNFRMAKTAVFHSDDRTYQPLLRYVALVVWLGIVSYGLVTVLVTVLGVAVIPAKALAEGLLFVASFVMQRVLVFRRVELVAQREP